MIDQYHHDHLIQSIFTALIALHFYCVEIVILFHPTIEDRPGYLNLKTTCIVEGWRFFCPALWNKNSTRVMTAESAAIVARTSRRAGRHCWVRCFSHSAETLQPGGYLMRLALSKDLFLGLQRSPLQRQEPQGSNR